MSASATTFVSYADYDSFWKVNGDASFEFENGDVKISFTQVAGSIDKIVALPSYYGGPGVMHETDVEDIGAGDSDGSLEHLPYGATIERYILKDNANNKIGQLHIYNRYIIHYNAVDDTNTKVDISFEAVDDDVTNSCTYRLTPDRLYDLSSTMFNCPQTEVSCDGKSVNRGWTNRAVIGSIQNQWWMGIDVVDGFSAVGKQEYTTGCYHNGVGAPAKMDVFGCEYDSDYYGNAWALQYTMDDDVADEWASTEVCRA